MVRADNVSPFVPQRSDSVVEGAPTSGVTRGHSFTIGKENTAPLVEENVEVDVATRKRSGAFIEERAFTKDVSQAMKPFPPHGKVSTKDNIQEPAKTVARVADDVAVDVGLHPPRPLPDGFSREKWVAAIRENENKLNQLDKEYQNTVLEIKMKMEPTTSDKDKITLEYEAGKEKITNDQRIKRNQLKQSYREKLKDFVDGDGKLKAPAQTVAGKAELQKEVLSLFKDLRESRAQEFLEGQNWQVLAQFKQEPVQAQPKPVQVARPQAAVVQVAPKVVMGKAVGVPLTPQQDCAQFLQGIKDASGRGEKLNAQEQGRQFRGLMEKHFDETFAPLSPEAGLLTGQAETNVDKKDSQVKAKRDRGEEVREYDYEAERLKYDLRIEYVKLAKTQFKGELGTFQKEFLQELDHIQKTLVQEQQWTGKVLEQCQARGKVLAMPQAKKLAGELITQCFHDNAAGALSFVQWNKATITDRIGGPGYNSLEIALKDAYSEKIYSSIKSKGFYEKRKSQESIADDFFAQIPSALMSHFIQYVFQQEAVGQAHDTFFRETHFLATKLYRRYVGQKIGEQIFSDDRALGKLPKEPKAAGVQTYFDAVKKYCEKLPPELVAVHKTYYDLANAVLKNQEKAQEKANEYVASLFFNRFLTAKLANLDSSLLRSAQALQQFASKDPGLGQILRGEKPQQEVK